MTTTQKENLLIVGSVAFDSIETPRGSVEMALGGSAVFASMAAGFFAQPLIVAIVGEDFTDEYIDMLENSGIDTKGLARVAGKTFHWRGKYRENFKERDTLETCLNVFEGFDPVLPEDYKTAKYVFLGNIDPVLQSKVLDQVENPEIVALDTMNFWITHALDSLKLVLKRTDILLINDEEAFQLSGADSILDAAGKILDLGPKYVIIKRGEYGALLFGANIRLFVPAFLLPLVVDPTGAGDAFAGGFMGCLAGLKNVSTSSLKTSLFFGTVTASFACESFSIDKLRSLGSDVIDFRLAELKSLIQFE
jgi:sugar/nucleoside kinase (ribokinase family)